MASADPDISTPDFSALGLKREEQDARKKLHADLLDKFEDLSRADLAARVAQVSLFPPFRAYVEVLLRAFATSQRSTYAKREDFGRGLRGFLGSVVNYVATPPSIKIPESQEIPFDVEEELAALAEGKAVGGGKFGTRGWYMRRLREWVATQSYTRRVPVFSAEGEDLGLEDEWNYEDLEDYIKPDCLWEQSISECTEDIEVQVKLSPGAADGLVYALREQRGDLGRSINGRLSSIVGDLMAGFTEKAPRQHGGKSDDAGHLATLEAIEKFDGDWSTRENLAKICPELDKATVKRYGRNKSVSWDESFRRKEIDSLRHDISYRIKKARKIRSS